ncbi:plasmid stabilization system protein [Campylobacter sputorum subsp. bubulus]|uniref:Plasmid stabilization system protein n=1 Tax=Campylobacter sputorum subsp. sputorum TaxID=32024 RepID=A0A381DL07_9BACT|nr:type II toxin-antitoxin system RelE/ParE family toxin [Campylobacter sputorum]ASM34648.1 putative toxin-antitoxin system, toxin component, RelE/ParE family [Campylobacter sputorum aubsp. sputorum RM3237]KAB0581138.1 type II toxin-antitoxin system RelE/ParE family toxin [Campylobacter sputorum subsp. sputorum]QEL04839.1 toxin-antitoxin system, toxin component, RelE/ParE family [Campylobacter sputorum subsp. sputorum]SUX09846.1 plasmid stabilization system protein [Campylobacter sputorum subsp
MEIRYSKKFNTELKNILDFISLDSKERAVNFARDLNNRILDATFMPYRFSKNKIINDENIRDLIFKNYVIPFAIKNNCIEILGIYKNNIWKP